MRRTLVACVAILVATTLTGCGGGDGAEPKGRASSSSSTTSYVALGDSYTAAPLVPTTDTASVCLRSDHNYPHLLAGMLGDTTLTDVSCSGATTSALTGSWKGLAPQLDAVTKDTDLVTVGIGANDFGLTRILFYQCRIVRPQSPTGSPCRTKWASWVRAALPQLEKNVTKVLRDVRERAPQARIIAVGYPQVLPASGSCAAMRVAAGDVAFIRALIDDIDEAVLAAARAANVDSLDLREASASHDMCSSDPWINGVVNLPGKAAAMHPFENEQQAVASLLAKMIKD